MLLPDDQAFKHRSLWGPLLFKIPHPPLVSLFLSLLFIYFQNHCIGTSHSCCGTYYLDLTHPLDILSLLLDLLRNSSFSHLSQWERINYILESVFHERGHVLGFLTPETEKCFLSVCDVYSMPWITAPWPPLPANSLQRSIVWTGFTVIPEIWGQLSQRQAVTGASFAPAVTLSLHLSFSFCPFICFLVLCCGLNLNSPWWPLQQRLSPQMIGLWGHDWIMRINISGSYW